MPRCQSASGNVSRLGVILFLCSAVAQAQTFTVLGSFNGPNGSNPANPGGSSIIQGPDGNFYGTTKLGGATGNGVIFKMTPSGALAALYSFSGQADGAHPQNGLTLGNDGNFYGTTPTSIFKITPSGSFTTLYDATTGSLGIDRFYGLTQASDGDFYGTSFDPGSAFRITPAGVVTVLYRFPGATPDLNEPTNTLIQGTDGNLYGSAMNGNVSSIFKMTIEGTVTKLATLPYDASPVGALVQGNDGNFYGVSQGGGINNGGSIFQMTPDGTLSTEYTFCTQPSCTDGQTPKAGLVSGKDGNFYGTTVGGGQYAAGTIFKLTLDGPLATLYSFCAQGGDCSDGNAPQGTLLQASDGTLYGASSGGGGSANLGGIFSLELEAFYVCSNTTPPVIASVNSASAYGAYPYFAPGSWLEIHGSNLADPNDPRLNNSTHSGTWSSADFNGSNAPTMLDGIRVTVDGKPAYVEYLSPTQLNVQAPADSNVGNVAITATNCHATSSPVMVPMRALAPGLLAPPNYSSGGKQYMVATNALDGTYVLNTALGASLGLLSRPAKSGDLIVAYGVGFGDVNPSFSPGVIPDQLSALVNPVTFSFVSASSSAVATLNYAGLAGDFVGLYEFYINVPMGLANGDYQIQVTQNGVAVPETFYLPVQN
jgi:uncharacterized protein (TIGR03437 family)